ncbi:MAG TPA: DUF4157 domain-containing protein [Longimicrobium sp.]|nr:DUF4157 domain-containing protein [Longimicrobium sp.]
MSTRATAARPAEPARVAETVPASTVSASRDAGASPARAPFSAPSADGRVSTLLAPRVQLETRVSSPSDPAEREAVDTARKVMRMAAPPPPPPAAGAAPSARPGLNTSPLLRAPTIHRSTAGAPPSTIHRAPAPAPRPRAAAAGPPRAADDVMAEVRSEMGGGAPLPASVRGFLEPRFRAGFGAVLVHTGEKAASLAARLSARAFTFGKHIFFGAGEYRPSDPAGLELIAHELTHTIQQKEVVQRQEAVTVSERSEPQVQRLGFDDILDWLADKANAIPGFRMFTIVLGVNPVNMSPVDRSAANILRAVVEFIPGGNLITRALDTYGIFDKVGGWIEGQIRGLGMVGSAFKSAITQFIRSLGIRDLFSPGSVWDRAKRIFTDPIDRLISFAKGFIGGILDFLREAVLRPLARLAEGTPAYPLLKAVLGKDPITGDPVPQDADALIGGFMTLIGQQEVYENIKKGNAVARALAWFKGALSGAIAFVSAVPGLIVSTLRSITLQDFLPITNLFGKVGRAFGGFVGSFLSWGLAQVLSLLQIIFEVVAPSVMPYVQKAAGAFRQIVRNPMGFMGNLIRAGVQGFRQFGANFLAHLRASLIGWLTGTMAGAAIYIPQALNLREIIKFVLSVLGLTWANIRAKLVRVVGETAVAAMEAGFAIVRTLVTQGPAAAWEQIREGIGNLQEMVMGQVMTFVRNRVVQAAITTLASSLIPGAGFIRAIIAIYDTVTFFVQRLRQIGAVVAAYIDSIAAIAAGNIGSAANRVETTMAGMLTLVVSFLAQIARLGNVSQAVLNIINRVRAPIDRALDRVVAWIVAQVRRLGSMLGGRDARSPAEKQRDLDRAVRELRPQVQGLLQRGTMRPLLLARLAIWRRQYRLTTLGIEGGRIQATINPSATMYTVEEVNIGTMLEPILAAAEAQYLQERTGPGTPLAANMARARADVAAGRPISVPLSPDELIQIQRELVSQQLQPAPLGTNVRGNRSTDLTTREVQGTRLQLRPRGSTVPGQFQSGQGLFVPDAGQYNPGDEFYNEQDPSKPVTRPVAINRQMGIAITNPQATTGLPAQVQGNVFLRDVVEPGRIPTVMAANRVGRALVGASLASEQEITTGRMAGAATHDSAAAGMRDFQGSAPVDARGRPISAARLDRATAVRRGSLAVVFLRLRDALQQGGRGMLKEAGGAPLARLATAFRNWLAAARPPQGQVLSEPEVQRLAGDLRRRLVEFLHAQTQQGGQ